MDCGIKHLVQHCHIHPDKKGKATLNFIETIPSGAKSEGYKSLKVVTRAQARKEVTQNSGDEKAEGSSRQSWRSRRQRRVNAKRKREEKLKQNQEPQALNNGKTIEGGSVLAEKVFKPLQAMLDAYEARIKPNQTQEERIRAYLDPELEIKRL